MANIELVINIPEEEYQNILHTGKASFCAINAIEAGTILPKGHGKLIDVEKLLTSEKPNGIADDVWKESHIYKLLSNAPTIIEADMAESEEISDRNLKMWEELFGRK